MDKLIPLHLKAKSTSFTVVNGTRAQTEEYADWTEESDDFQTIMAMSMDLDANSILQLWPSSMNAQGSRHEHGLYSSSTRRSPAMKPSFSVKRCADEVQYVSFVPVPGVRPILIVMWRDSRAAMLKKGLRGSLRGLGDSVGFGCA